MKKAMIQKYGSLEAWKVELRKHGKKGGENGVGHQFAHGKLDPSKIGYEGAIARHAKSKSHKQVSS